MCKNLVNNHPDNLNKKLSQASVGNGTIKGIRTALEKVKYAAVVSSEPTHTIRTPYLEEPDGCQLLPRTMLNTWTQGEDDESGTGNGMTHIKQYKFKLLLIGQIKVMEFICRPQQQGFQKRMSMAYYPKNVMEDDFQASEDSFNLIHRVHGYMHRFEMPARRRPYLSGHAQSMWIEFKQAVGEWIEEHRSEICEYSLAKLELRHSDVLRMAYVIQKLLRALVFLSGAVDKYMFLADDAIGPVALAGAVRSWRRQIQIHFAYYKFVTNNPLPSISKFGGVPASAPGPSDFLDGHRNQRAIVEEPLRDMDLLKQYILTHAQCQVDVALDRFKQRQILRRKQIDSDGQLAFRELEQAGLLKEVPDPSGSLSDTDMNPGTDRSSPNIDAASGSQSRRCGRPRAKSYLKRARAELDEASELELKRLRVSIHSFQRQG